MSAFAPVQTRVSDNEKRRSRSSKHQPNLVAPAAKRRTEHSLKVLRCCRSRNALSTRPTTRTCQENLAAPAAKRYTEQSLMVLGCCRSQNHPKTRTSTSPSRLTTLTASYALIGVILCSTSVTAMHELHRSASVRVLNDREHKPTDLERHQELSRLAGNSATSTIGSSVTAPPNPANSATGGKENSNAKPDGKEKSDEAVEEKSNESGEKGLHEKIVKTLGKFEYKNEALMGGVLLTTAGTIGFGNIYAEAQKLEKLDPDGIETFPLVAWSIGLFFGMFCIVYFLSSKIWGDEMNKNNHYLAAGFSLLAGASGVMFGLGLNGLSLTPGERLSAEDGYKLDLESDEFADAQLMLILAGCMLFLVVVYLIFVNVLKNKNDLAGDGGWKKGLWMGARLAGHGIGCAALVGGAGALTYSFSENMIDRDPLIHAKLENHEQFDNMGMKETIPFLAVLFLGFFWFIYNFMFTGKGDEAVPTYARAIISGVTGLALSASVTIGFEALLCSDIKDNWLIKGVEDANYINEMTGLGAGLLTVFAVIIVAMIILKLVARFAGEGEFKCLQDNFA